MARRKTRSKRAKASSRPTAREAYIGFMAPGQRYQGRVRSVPSTQLSAFGGGVAYDGGAEWAEGEPEEMRGKMVTCARPPAGPSEPMPPVRPRAG